MFCPIEFLSSCPSEEIVLTQGSMILLGPDKTSTLIQFGQKKGIFSALNGRSDFTTTVQDTEQFTVLHRAQVRNLQIEVGEDLPKLTQDQASKEKLLSLLVSHTVTCHRKLTITFSTKESVVMGGIQSTFDKIHQYTLASLAQQELRHALAVPGKTDCSRYWLSPTKIFHRIREHPDNWCSRSWQNKSCE